jgi:CelD/BcsL family acetyltransferase involved in cellulose biosynthesis
MRSSQSGASDQQLLLDLNVDWTNKKLQLRFCLSDFSLFTMSFGGLAQRCADGVSRIPHIERGSFPPGVDVISINDCPIAGPMPRLQFGDAFIRYTINQCFQYSIDMRGTFQEYLATLSSKTRSTLKRKVKKFAEAGEGVLDCRLYTTAEEMPEFHHLARTVAVETYQEKLFEGAIPAGEAFCSRMVELAAQDRVRAYVMFLGGEPVSYLYLPVEEDILEYSYLGYKPSVSEHSPGTVLLYLALEKLFSEQRFRKFDFSYGLSQTKEVFCTDKNLRADIHYFRKAPKNMAGVLGHAAIDSVSVACGRMAERMGLRKRIRKLLRST